MPGARSLVCLLAICGCDSEPDFPVDPRASYPGETVDGRPFPLAIYEDSIRFSLTDRRRRPARLHWDSAQFVVFGNNAVSSEQYQVHAEPFWVLLDTQDTLRVDGWVAYEAGEWDYDRHAGSFVFRTRIGSLVHQVTLRDGQFDADGGLEVHGTLMVPGLSRDITLRFGRQTPLPR